MKNDLIEPIKLAKTEAKLSGEMPIAALPRLAENLIAECDAITYVLDFSKDSAHRTLIQGKVEAELPMLCQRCLKPTKVKLTCDMNLAIVKTEEQAEALPEGLEPLLMAEDTVPLAIVIEDEVLLALPLVVLHESGSCSASAKLADINAKFEMSDERKHPFASLKDVL